MSTKFNQILAINLNADIITKLVDWSKKPALQALDIKSVELNNNNNQIDALLVSIYENLDQYFLSHFPNLKYIGVFGTSLKKIDLNYCADHNIKVSPVYEYCDHETAEWVLLQILKFYRERECPQSVYEKTLGLVGVGAVGFKLAQKALALGIKINFSALNSYPELTNMGAKALSKPELFKNSLIISFHTPAHNAWLSRELLDYVPKNALLINTCLGRISVDHELEQFLAQRPDVALIMDRVAAQSYPELKNRAIIDTRSAYETSESKQRLIDKFLKNLAEK